MIGWGPLVGGSLGSEAWRRKGRGSAWVPLELARMWLWLRVTDLFQGATQSFAPKLVFYTQGTPLPNSRVHLRKLVTSENPQRETPVSWTGGAGPRSQTGVCL